MRRPERLVDQQLGKARAELVRGSGWWPFQEVPCYLEPPWDPYNARSLTLWDCYYHDWEGPWDGSLLGQLISDDPILPYGSTLTLDPHPDGEGASQHHEVITVERFVTDNSTIPKAEQLLLALAGLRRPVAFELVGVGSEAKYNLQISQEILQARAQGEKRSLSEAICGWSEPYTSARFAAHCADATLLHRQLLAHYPDSAVVLGQTESHDLISINRLPYSAAACGGIAVLDSAFCYPLRTFTHLDPDPLGVAVAAMDQLDRDEWAILQVLFQPAKHAWAENVELAIQHPYKSSDFLVEKADVKLIRDKLRSPLFAVSVRLLASRRDVYQHLEGWCEQFANAPHQRLQMMAAECDDENDPGSDSRFCLSASVEGRAAYRPGMLLNLQELASLVHLPSESIASDRLRRIKTRTRPAKEVAAKGSIVLGNNVHRGQTRTARLPEDLRRRHCYLAGASGTGKSTLLLNMIMQDVSAGRGVGVLDPHGDLVKAVLERIPAQRVDDVVLFDPADEEYPFALNILEAKMSERERIVAETIMAFERYFPASWGPRLERILSYAIYTALDAIPGATLADVERLLIDDAFREEVVTKTPTPRFVQFWRTQYKFMPKNAADPVLNKLSIFLTHPVVRNIVCQRRSSIDFDSLLNDGKILLANLSTGLLTNKIAGIFGSFLVSKIFNAGMRRVRMPQSARRPWYLYVDEFQAFMNLSIGFENILSESRKFGLVLAGLANQYIGQLSPAVRQAIVGNVGAMVIFRLGVDDANLAAKELGIFTSEEVMNLEMGQAIARAGGSAAAFNIQTYPEPGLPLDDPSEQILVRMRQQFARPRADVERELGAVSTERSFSGSELREDEGEDPSEDDLVN